MPQNRHKSGFRGPSTDVGKGTQFQPGQSGNPAGRPKERLITDAIRKRLLLKVSEFLTPEEIARYEFTKAQTEVTVLELFADRFVRAALAGNSEGTRQFRELMDRIEGRVPLPLMGVEGGEFHLVIHSHIPRPDRRPKPAQRSKVTRKDVQ